MWRFRVRSLKTTLLLFISVWFSNSKWLFTDFLQDSTSTFVFLIEDHVRVMSFPATLIDLVLWYLPNRCTLSISHNIWRVVRKNHWRITTRDPNNKNKNKQIVTKWFLDCHWTGYGPRICLNSLGEMKSWRGWNFLQLRTPNGSRGGYLRCLHRPTWPGKKRNMINKLSYHTSVPFSFKSSCFQSLDLLIPIIHTVL